MMSEELIIKQAVASATARPCDHYGDGVTNVCSGCAERVAWYLARRLVEAEAVRDAALGLLNRWLSQHSAGGETDPCGVAPELVEETLRTVRP